jgi:hypothetical protein
MHSTKPPGENRKQPGNSRNKPAKPVRRSLFSGKIARATAPNPVTALWTGCTRLKMRLLQMQVFD